MARFPAAIRPFRVLTPAGVLDKAEVYTVLREVLAAAETAGDQEVLVIAAVFWAEMRHAVEIQVGDWEWLLEQHLWFGIGRWAVARTQPHASSNWRGHIG